MRLDLAKKRWSPLCATSCQPSPPISRKVALTLTSRVACLSLGRCRGSSGDTRFRHTIGPHSLPRVLILSASVMDDFCRSLVFVKRTVFDSAYMNQKDLDSRLVQESTLSERSASIHLLQLACLVPCTTDVGDWSPKFRPLARALGFYPLMTRMNEVRCVWLENGYWKTWRSPMVGSSEAGGGKKKKKGRCFYQN